MTFKNFFDKIIKEEEIGALALIDGYRITVYSKEAGNIPHIHFFKGNSPKKSENEGCVSLREVGYANHGHHKGMLDRKTWKKLCDWLSNDSNYFEAVRQWNEGNQDNFMPAFNPYNQ